MAGDDELKRLAARGRQQRARADSARQAEARQAELEARQAKERRLRTSLSSYARWGWIVAGLAGALPFALPFALHVGALLPDSAWEGEGPGGLAVLGVMGLGLALGFLLRPRLGDVAVERERQWLASLPFRIEGYPELLTERDGYEGRLSVRLAFAEDAPDDDLLQDLLGAVGARRRPGARERFETSFDFGESSASTNAHLVRWIHSVVRALLALHGRHPLRTVRFRLEG